MRRLLPLHLLLACGLAGCAATRGDSVAGAPEAPVAGTRNEDYDGDGFAHDARLVPPRFNHAVARYAAEVRSMRIGMDGVEQDDVARALELLADAIDAIPFAGQVDVHAAAATLRGPREVSRGSARHAGTRHRLEVASTTLLSLARGSYRTAPAALERAFDFDDAVRKLEQPFDVRSGRAELVVALERALRTLKPMRAAIGRGEVRRPR